MTRLQRFAAAICEQFDPDDPADAANIETWRDVQHALDRARPFGALRGTPDAADNLAVALASLDVVAADPEPETVEGEAGRA